MSSLETSSRRSVSSSASCSMGHYLHLLLKRQAKETLGGFYRLLDGALRDPMVLHYIVYGMRSEVHTLEKARDSR